MKKRTGFHVQKILSLLLVCVLLLSPGTTAAAEEDAGLSAAEALHALGLFEGTGAGADGAPAYDLDRAPTRHEAVTMLVRLLGAADEAIAGAWDTPFTDVAEWAAPYVGYAYAKGLTAGTSATAYGGDAPVSAAQYLTFVLRALGYRSGTDFRWDAAWELSDALGITSGQYPSQAPFTRGDVAVVSFHALSARQKESGKTLLEALDLDARQETPPKSSFEVHFIDVGQADAALVLCDGAAMLIDGGNAADSSRIYTYLKTRSVEVLDYIVCTHPHEDHVGGLAGALNYARAVTALCPVTEYDTRAFQSFVHYLGEQNVPLTVPSPGDTFSLGSASVEVLGPLTPSVDMNNASIVLRIVYGETSFLFTGDAEREEEQSLLDAGVPLHSTVLKVGHHGSGTSTSYPFLYAVDPACAVISVGAGNGYGHPAEAVLSRLRDAGTKVYRTDMQGDIVCVSDGENVSFTVSRNGGADTLTGAGGGHLSETEAVPPADGRYILNTNSQIFHRETCSSAARMSEKNKLVYEGTRDEIVAMGYRACSVCQP